MAQYRNTGAHFQRADGSWVGRDVIFEPTPEELAQFSYKLKPALVKLEPEGRTAESEQPPPPVSTEASYEGQTRQVRHRPNRPTG